MLKIEGYLVRVVSLEEQEDCTSCKQRMLDLTIQTQQHYMLRIQQKFIGATDSDTTKEKHRWWNNISLNNAENLHNQFHLVTSIHMLCYAVSLNGRVSQEIDLSRYKESLFDVQPKTEKKIWFWPLIWMKQDFSYAYDINWTCFPSWWKCSMSAYQHPEFSQILELIDFRAAHPFKIYKIIQFCCNIQSWMMNTNLDLINNNNNKKYRKPYLCGVCGVEWQKTAIAFYLSEAAFDLLLSDVLIWAQKKKRSAQF